MKWILIVAFFAPDGTTFIDKVGIEMPSRVACVNAADSIPKRNDWGTKAKGICVTLAHWQGRDKTEGVEFD